MPTAVFFQKAAQPSAKKYFKMQKHEECHEERSSTSTLY